MLQMFFFFLKKKKKTSGNTPQKLVPLASIICFERCNATQAATKKNVAAGLLQHAAVLSRTDRWAGYSLRSST